LKPERWGSPLVQEKYREEKACDKRHPYRIIIIKWQLRNDFDIFMNMLFLFLRRFVPSSYGGKAEVLLYPLGTKMGGHIIPGKEKW